jgi:hypothetical protein
MDKEIQSELRELRRLITGMARMLVNPRPKPKPKPAPRPAAPVRELTELEKIQRHFEFLREHPECGFGPRRR